MTRAQAEALGDGSANGFQEMAFSIEKVAVTAVSRALKAEYTMELAQDLKAIHGLDAETELANILSSEILAEINREVVRVIYANAKLGAKTGTTQSQGIFDLNVDSNGRWSVEKFKGLLFQIERECNMIAKETRRGKGNFIVCSSDVASALSMAGVLDYAPALSTNLNVDDTGNTFAGVLNGKLRVYIDPYSSMTTSHDFFMAGYKGSSAYDAGMFYCPYVPLQMVRAVGEQSFQPKIGFKTRYGLVNNPFATITAGAVSQDPYASASRRANIYYRIVKVTNRMIGIIMGATFGVMLLYIFSFVLSIFGARPSFLTDSSGLGIALSVGICVIAALNLLVDFAFIERGVEAQAPAIYEWYSALSLLSTMVWLYLEVLRLLGRIQGR